MRTVVARRLAHLHARVLATAPPRPRHHSRPQQAAPAAAAPCSSSLPMDAAAPTVPASSAAAVAALEPAALWQHFATLSSIPRPSKQEDR
jgi:hypothetical protein